MNGPAKGAHDGEDLLSRFFLYPLLHLLRYLKKIVERLIRRGGGSGSEMIEEEFQSLINEGMKQGVMDKDDKKLLHSVIEFGDTIAREVMVPRMDMVAIEQETSLEEILEIILRYGHTRLPVYRESIDNVAGILHSKDLLAVRRDGKEEIVLKELLRPVIIFPENQRISVLLREMKKLRTHLAIVVDEFGGTAGLITLEDMVEEIIGEVEDEFDRDEELFQEKDGGLLVDTRFGLWALVERLGIPEEELKFTGSETVGGMMGELLGRLPRRGEEVSLGEYVFRVAQMDGRRVTKVEIRRLQ